jgi:alkylation response protein AidB-like acyl-CoA dehydrogenase
MPVNSIWEGSGNIMCLDVLRVLAKQPGIHDLLADEFAQVKGQDRHFDRSWRQLQQKLRKPQEAQGGRSRSSFSCWVPEARCCGTHRPRWRRRGAA